MIKRTLARLRCVFGFHQRMKRIDGPRIALINGVEKYIVVYQCGRCLNTEVRKAAKPKPTPPIPASIRKEQP